uniref:Uncharacterized protein n=1 Tax=Arundo donax TaxID=35708 RepID=A0A0A8YY84_ARUDO
MLIPCKPDWCLMWGAICWGPIWWG